MFLKRIKLVFTILGISLIVLLAACNQQPVTELSNPEADEIAQDAESAAVTEEVGSGEKATVVWWTQPRGDVDQFLEENFAQTFRDQNPDIDFQMLFRENHEELIRIALQAGNAPDIIQTNGPAEVIDLAAADLVIPLNKYVEEYNWEDMLLPWAYEVGLIEGELYSIPQAYESMLLYYNNATLDELGIAPPTSLEDIEEACRLADESDKICFANSLGGKASRGEWWIGWHLNAGAGPDKVYAALNGEIPWTDPAFEEAFARNLEWIQAGWYGGSIDNYNALDFDQSWVLLGDGDALFRVAGNWDFGRMQKFCGDDCDWMPAPSLNPNIPTHFELAIGESLAITADSKYPDAAAKVLNHMFDKPQAASIIEAFDYGNWIIPIVWEQEDFSDEGDPRVLRFLEEFSDVTSQGNFGYTTWTFFPPETRTYIYEGFQDLVYGDISMEEYLNTIDEIFQSELGSVPPAPQTGIQQ